MNDDIIQLQIQPEILNTNADQFAKDVSNTFSDIAKRISALFKQVDTSSMTKSVTNTMSGIIKAYDKAESAATKFTETVIASQLYDEAVENLQKIQDKLKEVQASYKYSEQWANHIADMDPGKLMTEFRQAGHFITRDTATKAIADAKEYVLQLEILRTKEDALNVEMQQLNDIMDESDTRFRAARAAMLTLEGGINSLQSTIESASAIAEQSEIVPEDASVKAQRLVSILSRVRSILSGVGQVASKAFSVMRSMVNSVVRALSSLHTKLKQVFKQFNKGHRGLNLDTKKLTKTFIQFGLGARSAYFLIRRLRTEFIKAMKEMASKFPEINAQISQFTMLVKGYKGSLITMLQPIITAVIPVLSQLLSLLTQLNFRLAEFFATLTGQHVIYKATADNVDYANSLDGVADAADKANDKLGEYDNLLVIGQDTAGSGGSGGGSSASDLGYSFEEEEIGVSEFAQKLKEAWSNADFGGVGEIVAEKLNSIIDAIDLWITTKLQPKGEEWAQAVAQIINGFFSKIDADEAGETVANFFNALFNIVNTFATTVDWAQVGTKVGNAIVSAIKNFDAASAGETVRNFFLGLFTAGINLLQQNPGGELGKKLAEFINSLFDPDSGTIGTFIGSIINNITSFFISIFTNVNWEDIKKSIQTNLSSLFSELNLDEEGLSPLSSAFSSIGNIVEGIINVFKKVDFEKVFGSLLTLLESISSVLETIWTVIEPVITFLINDIFPRLNESTGGVLDSISKFLLDIQPFISPLLNFLAEIGTFITELTNSGLSTTLTILGELLQPLAVVLGKILEIAQPILEAVSGIIGRLSDGTLEIVLALLEPLSDVLLTIFDILSPLLEILTPIFELIMDIVDLALTPLLSLIKIFIYLITGDFESAGEEMKTMFGDIKAKVDKVKTTFENLKTKVVEVVEKIKTKVTEFAGKIKEKFELIKTGIVNAFTTVKTKIVGIWTTIKTWVITTVTTIKNKIVGIFTTIRDKIVGAFNTVKTKIVNIWTTIKTWITNKVTAIKDKIVGAFNTVRDKVVGAFTTVRTKLEDIWNKIWNAIKAPINWILGGIETMANGVVKGINAVIRTLNKLHFDIPDWVPLIGGKSFGFNIGYLSEVSLPRLAQGTVIPPNKEFLAVLGDQSSGTNIEAPLDTIKQALAEVMSQMGGLNMPEKIQIVMPNGKVLAETVWNEERKLYKQTGSYSPRFA